MAHDTIEVEKISEIRTSNLFNAVCIYSRRDGFTATKHDRQSRQRDMQAFCMLPQVLESKSARTRQNFLESVVYVPGVILIMSQDYSMYYAKIGMILNITSRAAPSNLGGTHQFRVFEC